MFIDGQAVTAHEGETIAAVLLAEEHRLFRHTSHSNEARSLFCGMGICYDCLVTVDGQGNVRACVTSVEEDMRVETGPTVEKQRSMGARDHDLGDSETITSQQSPTNWEQMTEVAVVGAGPAGLEAALMAAEAGAQVTLIDSSPLPGGQYFKQPPQSFQTPDIDGKASDLFSRLSKYPSLQLFTDTQVWGAFPESDDSWLLTLQGQNTPVRLRTRVLILAPGAYDRPIAFPGWTLPGVMTAGAVQALLKSQAVVPGRRFVLAGSGPLQLVVAAQLVKAGADIAAVLEATSLSQFRSIRHIPAIWGQWARMQEGVSAWRTLRRAGVSIRFGWGMVKAGGEEQVEVVEIAKLDQNWHPLPNTSETIDADTLVLGYGFLPSTQLTRLLGCEHQYSPHQGGWIPLRDVRMQTTLPGVYAIGDGAGIGGATLARIEGQLAGLDVALRLGRIEEQRYQSELAGLHSKLERERRFADLLGELFTLRNGLYTLAKNDTIICRCEEVRLTDIRQAQAAGCSTLNEIKGLTRAGMGNCQGRICGDLLANTLLGDDLPQQDRVQGICNLGALSIRPPIFPMTVQDLAQSTISGPETDHAR